MVFFSRHSAPEKNKQENRLKSFINLLMANFFGISSDIKSLHSVFLRFHSRMSYFQICHFAPSQHHYYQFQFFNNHRSQFIFPNWHFIRLSHFKLNLMLALELLWTSWTTGSTLFFMFVLFWFFLFSILYAASLFSLQFFGNGWN
jgi:hypothetical protein